MKLDKDLFPANMNMVELDGKKVLVWPSQDESTKGKQVVIGEERQPRMTRPKTPKIGRWKKNERSKPRSRPKVTFDILMAKYRDGKADIRGCENWTIWFPKLDHLVSLDQVSTSMTRSSSSNQSRTLPQQDSEGQDHHQQEHHLTLFFSIRLPMLGPWGPLSMMYPPYPPWAEWYGPWTPPPMHFHPGWSGPAEGFSHVGYYIGDSCYGSVGHQHDKKALR
jgi:hypothetical protein